MSKVIFDNLTVNQALDSMANSISSSEIYMIGIQRGGARVADALQHRLQKQKVSVQRGNLDISFYRDDLDTIAPNPEVRPSKLPFDLSDKNIWLIDDVLYTGRTIRAALGEIFDYGRPASIKLAVLLDRGGRELPIAADLVGLAHQAKPEQSVKLITDPEGWFVEQRQVKS